MILLLLVLSISISLCQSINYDPTPKAYVPTYNSINTDRLRGFYNGTNYFVFTLFNNNAYDCTEGVTVTVLNKYYQPIITRNIPNNNTYTSCSGSYNTQGFKWDVRRNISNTNTFDIAFVYLIQNSNLDSINTINYDSRNDTVNYYNYEYGNLGATNSYTLDVSLGSTGNYVVKIENNLYFMPNITTNITGAIQFSTGGYTTYGNIHFFKCGGFYHLMTENGATIYDHILTINTVDNTVSYQKTFTLTNDPYNIQFNGGEFSARCLDENQVSGGTIFGDPYRTVMITTDGATDRYETELLWDNVYQLYDPIKQSVPLNIISDTPVFSYVDFFNTKEPNLLDQILVSTDIFNLPSGILWTSSTCLSTNWENVTCEDGLMKQMRSVLPVGCDYTTRYVSNFQCSQLNGTITQQTEEFSNSTECLSSFAHTGSTVECYMNMEVPINCINTTISVYPSLEENLYTQYSCRDVSGDVLIGTCIPSYSCTNQNATCTDSIKGVDTQNTTQTNTEQVQAGTLFNSRVTGFISKACNCNRFFGLSTLQNGVETYRIHGYMYLTCTRTCITENVCVDAQTTAIKGIDCQPRNQTLCSDGCDSKTGSCKSSITTTTTLCNGLDCGLFQFDPTTKFVIAITTSLVVGVGILAITNSVSKTDSVMPLPIGFGATFFLFLVVGWIPKEIVIIPLVAVAIIVWVTRH